MLFPWNKKEHRRQLLTQPFPEEWERFLERNVYHDRDLTDRERTKLRDDLRILIHEKNWEGCNGLTITDEIKVTIAALAALLLLGFENRYFDMVQSILVYPDSYVRKGQVMLSHGLLIEGDSHLEGETSYRGPVILSWDDTLRGGRRITGRDNLVLHEFAHQLDMENGRMPDGVPPIESKAQASRWLAVMELEFDKLKRACQRGEATLLDCYGTTNTAEFFAVCTESFFEQPQAIYRHHPDLYEILKEFYNQDPKSRETGISRSL